MNGCSLLKRHLDSLIMCVYASSQQNLKEQRQGHNFYNDIFIQLNKIVITERI